MFGFEEFWPKVYELYKPQFDAITELIRLGDEIVKAADESASEPARKVICALIRAAMTGACEAVVLCGNGCGAGAMKVARGMYESRWTAEYLRRHPEEVEDYLEFSKILSWRRLHWLQGNRPSEASRVPSETAKRVEDDYNQAKARFTDDKGRVRFQWSSKSMREIAKDIGREKEYELPYSIACSVHHGNFEGLSTVFSSKDGAIAPDPPPSTAWVSKALLAAHTNLWFALITLNDACQLSFSDKLSTAHQSLSAAWKD